VEQEQRHDGSLFRAAERDRAPVDSDLERAEHEELDGAGAGHAAEA
jgi:hypothetical protein